MSVETSGDWENPFEEEEKKDGGGEKDFGNDVKLPFSVVPAGKIYEGGKGYRMVPFNKLVDDSAGRSKRSHTGWHVVDGKNSAPADDRRLPGSVSVYVGRGSGDDGDFRPPEVPDPLYDLTVPGSLDECLISEEPVELSWDDLIAEVRACFSDFEGSEE